MIETRGIDPCVSFISSQFKSGGEVGTPVRRAVTISRQAGCGALAVAGKLARYLQTYTVGDSRPWAVYDSNLIDKVLADHGLPPYLAKFLREDRVSQLEDLMADVLGALPPTATVIQHVTETMHRLVATGNVILIGRGGNVVTAKLPHVFHVRLVAPLDKRIEHCVEAYQMTRDKACKFCPAEDHARQRYFRKYFNANIDDPLLYHMIINTGQMTYDAAARLIGEAVLNPDQGAGAGG
ncbi:MAG TPA: cytidylate kinase-like family protein [Candidatus Acidoferrales bacterium]|nr:cytidylate kinase-like family protein [Candidatus Acidoferrales bacterium]